MDAFQRVKVIGKGSYGEVWLALHVTDGKNYVLKKMELREASRRERKAAEQEAKLLSKLKHPNIVAYKDSFETDDGLLWIAMGYCEGGDLYTYLKARRGVPLDERQIVEWFVQIAMALQYLHERNVLHRDLKTQNIFLTRSRIIKVGDLGIARVLDSESDMATTLIGTPYYMSPELFSNKPYNHKSDVWALGCCVHEMATLRHAFNAKDMNSLVYRILRGRTPPMPELYSRDLADLVKAMLSQNPARRPTVSKILRDPYIRKNIAIFLEGTKIKSKRSSAGAGGELGAASRVASASGSARKAAVDELPVRAVPRDLDTISEASQSESDATHQSHQQPRIGSGGRHGGRGAPSRLEDGRPSSGGDAKPLSHPRSNLAAAGSKVSENPSAVSKPRHVTIAPAVSAARAAESDERVASAQRRQSHPKESKITAGPVPTASAEPISLGTNPNLSARARRREKKSQSADFSQMPASFSPVLSDPHSSSPPDRQQPRQSQPAPQQQQQQKKGPVVADEEPDSVDGNEDERESRRSEKDMANLATLLDATLHMQPELEDEEEEVDEEEVTLVPTEHNQRTPAISARNASSGSVAVPRRQSEPVLRSPPVFGQETMGSTTRLNERIVALRKDCLRGVGFERLHKAFQILDEIEGDELEERLLTLLGRDAFDAYAGKIWQLKFCEDSAYRMK